MGRPIKHDLTNHRFGRLTVIGRLPYPAPGWECICDCGQKKVLLSANLRGGKTTSCGCLRKEWLKNQPAKRWYSKTREHRAWNHARKRVTNKTWWGYNRYGGRGITMCERWLNSFEAFFADMGPCPKGHELDRIDNDGNYEPSNCRWASRLQQMNHTSATRWVEHDGKRMSVADWAREKNMSYTMLIQRLNAGVPAHIALSQPKGMSAH